MNSTSTFQSPLSPFKRGRFTKKESTKRAFTLSLIAHLGLLAFLVIGISWNNSTPSGVEVELWDANQQVQTPVVPEVKTEVKEEAADIAIKKKKVEKKKFEKEKYEKEKVEKELKKEKEANKTGPVPLPCTVLLTVSFSNCFCHQ